MRSNVRLQLGRGEEEKAREKTAARAKPPRLGILPLPLSQLGAAKERPKLGEETFRDPLRYVGMHSNSWILMTDQSLGGNARRLLYVSIYSRESRMPTLMYVMIPCVSVKGAPMVR